MSATEDRPDPSRPKAGGPIPPGPSPLAPAPPGLSPRSSPFAGRTTIFFLFATFALVAVEALQRGALPPSATLSEPATAATKLAESPAEVLIGLERIRAGEGPVELPVQGLRRRARDLAEAVRDELSGLAAEVAGREEVEDALLERAEGWARDAHEMAVRALIWRALEGFEADSNLEDYLRAVWQERRPEPLLRAVLYAFPPPGLELGEPPAEVREAAEALAGSLSGDLLREHLARRAGDEAAAEAVRSEWETRAMARGERTAALAAGGGALFLGGLVALLVLAVRRAAPPRLGWGEIPVAGDPQFGMDVFARGLFAFFLVQLVLGAAAGLGLGVPLGVVTLVSWLPLLLMVLIGLSIGAPGIRPAELDRHAFPEGRGRSGSPISELLSRLGLRVTLRGLLASLLLVLAVLPVQVLGFLGTQVLAQGLFGSGPWIESHVGLVLTGTDTQVLGLRAEATLWAPLFEEIAFRGLLFAALRSRMGFAGAAISSSLLFGAVHLYGPAGLIGVTWLGVVFCWVYERTRSLWPCILLHALHNHVALSILVLLR